MNPDSQNNNPYQQSDQPPQSPPPGPGQPAYPLRPSNIEEDYQPAQGQAYNPNDPNQPPSGLPGVPPSQPAYPQAYTQAALPQDTPPSNPMPFIEPQLPNPSYNSGGGGFSVARVFFSFLILIIIGAAAAWFVPASRLWIVNAAGLGNTVRVTTVTTAPDSNQEQLLKNVTVTVDGQNVKTNAKGEAQINNVSYGQLQIGAAKDGYASATHRGTLDFNPFFNNSKNNTPIKLRLTTDGPEVSFRAVDWLTDKPITTGSFTIGDIVAKPSKQGVVAVQIPKTTSDQVEASSDFSDGTYVNNTFNVLMGSEAPPNLVFVPAGKYYFVSKREDGLRTVYRSDLDGGNVETVVKGTGKETGTTEIMVSPDQKYGVLVSARDGAVNSQGQPLERLYVVDLKTKKLTKIDEAVFVKLGDWSGDSFGYILNGTEADGAKTATMRRVNAANGRVYNFETATTISPVGIAFDKVAYISENSDNPAKSPELKIANLQGSNIQTIGERVDPASVQHLSYGRLTFKSDADLAWHEYNMATSQSKNVAQPDINLNVQTRYTSVPSPDKTKRLFLVGSGFNRSLHVEDIKSGAKKELMPTQTLTRGIRWLNNSVVVLSYVDQEGAGDYAVAVSLDGGTVKLIKRDD